MDEKPNCYACKWRRDLPGDCHSRCLNLSAHVTGHLHGIRRGWFLWPFDFDPVWLITCDGFEAKESKEENK